MPHPTQGRAPSAGIARARTLRQPQTPAEQVLWAHLRNRQLAGFKFHRQQPLGHFVVDLYCHECRLVVELDGEAHAGREDYDAARTAWLSERGYRVIRFLNDDVRERLEGVLEAILEECRRAGKGDG